MQAGAFGLCLTGRVLLVFHHGSSAKGIPPSLEYLTSVNVATLQKPSAPPSADTHLSEEGGQPLPSVVVGRVDPDDADETDQLRKLIRDVLRLHEG